MMKKVSAVIATIALVGTMSFFSTACQTLKGDATYKRVPEAQHKAQYPKGHDGSKNCYYDEKNAVFFCEY